MQTGEKRMIESQGVTHSFERYDTQGQVCGKYQVLRGVDIHVNPGDFVAVLGANGSGKSTFAKHINAILTPEEGTLYVNDLCAGEPDNTLAIRQSAGLVFQNPDNQIISNVVEEDVAFGPENLGVPPEQIRERVTQSLNAVDMLEYREHSPGKLSGGQKQRVAIAGILAMHPKCIVMDEATAMLDPIGRRSVHEIVKKLHVQEKMTVLWITHHMEEVTDADYMYVMSQGRVALEGTPEQIFRQSQKLQECRLEMTMPGQVAQRLCARGITLSKDAWNAQALCHEIAQRYRNSASGSKQLEADSETADPKRTVDEEKRVDTAKSAGSGKGPVPDVAAPLLSLQGVQHVYGVGSGYETTALRGITLQVFAGEFIGVAGHTGSGKSTLMQVIGGLEKPTQGDVLYRGQEIYEKKVSRKERCSDIGFVFQYPEHQLFEVTVLEDVAFGPRNQGLNREQARQRAVDALELVGVREDLWEMAPFTLSGGQKRRVAIAGVLAMQPSVLILDEPTAGLDPAGREEMLELLRRLHEEQGMTILLVSHSMDDIAGYAERLWVMKKGKLVYDGGVRQAFSDRDRVHALGLDVPQCTGLMYGLRQENVPVRTDVLSAKEAADEIARVLGVDNDSEETGMSAGMSVGMPAGMSIGMSATGREVQR